MNKYLTIILLVLSFSVSSQASLNADGVYWSTVNLSVSKFNNGDPIFKAKSDQEWIQACKEKKPAYMDVLNSMGKTEKLYNYYVLMDKRGILPKDTRYPTGQEYLKFNDFLSTHVDKVKNMNFHLTDTYLLNSCNELIKEKSNDFWYLDIENMPIADMLEMDMGPSMGILTCENESGFPICTNGSFSGIGSTGALNGGLGSGKLVRFVYTKAQ